MEKSFKIHYLRIELDNLVYDYNVKGDPEKLNKNRQNSGMNIKWKYSTEAENMWNVILCLSELIDSILTNREILKHNIFIDTKIFDLTKPKENYILTRFSEKLNEITAYYENEKYEREQKHLSENGNNAA